MSIFWTIPDGPPSNPDCFVIPSFAFKSRTMPTRPTRAQIELAIDWWRQFPQAKLVMSTGDNQRLGVFNLNLYMHRAVSTARKMGWTDFCWLSEVARG